jgi:phosphate transport system ATP-binding protein
VDLLFEKGAMEKTLNRNQTAIKVKNLDLFYGPTQALYDINMDVEEKKVTAFIGPSGCGKSTLLRCFNRMNDLVDDVTIKGQVEIYGEDIYQQGVDVIALRKRTGMVFQKTNPFPKSIYENVVFGMRIDGIGDKRILDQAVEENLKIVGLWDEVKDRLLGSALELSGGQQQRLCIARAIATSPEVLLMDEPCSALDPIATGVIEELILKLKENFTVVIVTHNMQQAGRISDKTAFFLLGKMVEYDTTSKIFTNPAEAKTEAYITGRFG